MSSMDTIMEDSDYSVSNTNAIIFNGASDFSVRTESLISDPNIPNSSSTSEDEYQQQISTAAGGGGTDSMTVSSCGSSSWFNNNNDKQSDQQEIRIFNVDFRALSSSSSPRSRPHECSVCGLEFLTGQALGGHMGRHRAAIMNENVQVIIPQLVNRSSSTRVFCLDLNSTPSELFSGKEAPLNVFL